MNAKPANLWERLPFVGRLLVTASLALLVAGATMLWVSARQEAEDSQRDLRAELTKELEALPPALAEVVVVGDFATLQQLLDRYVAKASVARVAFRDTTGIELESRDKPVPTMAPAWFARSFGFADVSGDGPLLVGGRSYGQLFITLSSRHQANRAWHRLVNHLSVLLLAIAIDFLGIWWVLRSGLRPLDRLEAAAGALATGAYDTRLPAVGGPEMRQLIEVFNRMAEAIQQSQTRLRESEAYNKVLFTGSHLPLVVLDPDSGRFLDCNQAAADIYRLGSREAVIGLTLSDVSAPTQYDGSDSASAARGHIQQARADQVHVFEWRHQRPDGEIWDAEVRLMVVGLGGRPLMQFALQDITERRRAEAALKASEERLTLALEGAALGLWDWHVPSGRVSFNARGAAMLGYQPEEIAPHVSEWEKRVHPEDMPRVRAALEPHLRGETSRYVCEYRLLHKDGRWIWVLDAGRVLERDAAGQPLRAVGIHLDISAAKDAELALRARERHLRTLIASMDDVVFLIDTAGRITEFHWPAATDYARPEPERFLGRDYGDAFPAAASAAIGEAIAGLMADSQPRRADLALVPGDPSRHFQATFSAISDGSPWPQGFLCVARDVTEARRREARGQLLVAALEAAANGILITDRDAVIEWVNPAFSALTGYSREEAIGRRPALVKSGLHDDGFYQSLWRTILGGQVWQGEVVNRRKNGQLYHEELTITPVRDDRGHIHHFIAIKQDISARKAEEEAARLARAEIERLSQRNELLLNSAGEGIFGTDLAGRATFINPAALTMLGFEREEVIGRDQHELFHHHHADGSPYPAEECPVFRTLQDGVHREVEDVFVRKSGEVFPVLLTVTPMVENGQRVGVEVVFQDIAARKAMEQELRRLATTDFLTGVANRRHFMERLELELERIRRFGRPAALLMVDLDHFKVVNDTHGHAVGDAVLRHFASLAQRRLRRIDLLGRLGGEEFAILLPGTDRAGARDFAEAFRRQVEATPAQSDKGPIPFTISIGIADIDPRDAQADDLLARADDRLYAAKQKGRNRVEGDPA